MQISIEYIEQVKKNSIDYLQAEALYKIKILSEKYEKARETARYLYGNKRGAWGRMTQADEKRSAKLDNMREQLKNTKEAYNLKYGF